MDLLPPHLSSQRLEVRSEVSKLYIGDYGPWYWQQKLYLEQMGIASHKHVIGITGQGKSKFLAHCFVELVAQGVGASLIDPHSDLADDVLAMLADRGLADDRLVFVDFGRRDRFLPFNVLDQDYPYDKLAAQMVEACKRVWPALDGGVAPMFENVMLAGCRTLIENHLPFAALPLLISDKRYRDRLLANCTDPLAVQYFRSTFDPLRPADQLDQAQSSLRRVFLLNFPEELRYTLGQSENRLNIRDIMDSGKSAIYDLGGLSQDAQKFLGALITHGYEEASLARSDIHESQRVPHHLFLDEFSMFSSTTEEGLGRILSLARKYKLTLWLAHQTWGQLSDRIANALQNTTRMSFALGFTDSRIMSPNFTHFEPLAVKYAEEEGPHPLRQFVGVQETYERMAGELQQLKPRHLYIRYPTMKRHYWFFKKPAIKIAKVKTPSVKTTTTREQLKELREHYGKVWLRPRAEAEQEVLALLRHEEETDEPPAGF